MPDPASGFEPVLARLKSDAQTPFGVPGAEIEPLRRIEGPYSTVLRVRVRTGASTTYAYVKVSRPRGEGPEETARLQRFLLREYRATRALNDALGARHDVGALRPLAFLPEFNAIVTEEVSGEPLAALVKRARRADSALLESFHRVGRWLRMYQGMEEPSALVDLAERRAYLDDRLALLVGRIITPATRAEVLAHIDPLRRELDGRRIPAVLIHADLTLTNVMVGTDGRVTVLDFAMAKTGTPVHDLAHMHFHLSLAAGRRMRRTALYAELQRALLAGYDPELSAGDPLFRLMLWQHAVCHVAMLAERRVPFGDLAYRWFLKRRWESCVRGLVS
jgi:Ser/Thr protein kinase RdoA (MazF antagonist)